METVKQHLYSVNSAAAALDCGRTTLYYLIKAGLIKCVKFGNEKRIPASELERIAAEGLPSIPKP